MKLCDILCLAVALGISRAAAEDCNKEYFGQDSFVCTCDDRNCSYIGEIPPPENGFFHLITSTAIEKRFDLSTAPLDTAPTFNASVHLSINNSDIRQQMWGFGGAFTDAAGINLDSLSDSVQDMLLRSYFAPEGIEYNMARIPIGGTDFSPRPYSLDDVENDVDLINFNLTVEDINYKIPFIKRAINMSERQLNFFGSPWSPPTWMKTNGMFNGTGGLVEGMEQPWANYFVKFVEAYESYGVPIWGLTAQNEPIMGSNDHKWNACHFTPEQQLEFVRDYLGPTLSVANFRRLKLMVTDDTRAAFPQYPETVLNDTTAASYVDGVGVHWYFDELPPSLLDDCHNSFPDKFLLYTEADNGYISPEGFHVLLGNWRRGALYVQDIIQNVNHWVTGWVDWNLALSLEGGPNWASNYADSAVIVNQELNAFYKQPMFYGMGHFSKFLPEGSYVLGNILETEEDENIFAASFLDTIGNVVIVMLNKEEFAVNVTIEDSFGNFINMNVEPDSMNTIVYDPST